MIANRGSSLACLLSWRWRRCGSRRPGFPKAPPPLPHTRQLTDAHAHDQEAVHCDRKHRPGADVSDTAPIVVRVLDALATHDARRSSAPTEAAGRRTATLSCEQTRSFHPTAIPPRRCAPSPHPPHAVAGSQEAVRSLRASAQLQPVPSNVRRESLREDRHLSRRR